MEIKQYKWKCGQLSNKRDAKNTNKIVQKLTGCIEKLNKGRKQKNTQYGTKTHLKANIVKVIWIND